MHIWLTFYSNVIKNSMEKYCFSYRNVEQLNESMPENRINIFCQDFKIAHKIKTQQNYYDDSTLPNER